MPGVDYMIKGDRGKDWVAFPDVDGRAHLRRARVLAWNKRPNALTFFFWGGGRQCRAVDVENPSGQRGLRCRTSTR